MYKNIISFFSFPLICKMYEWLRVSESKMAEMHIHGHTHTHIHTHTHTHTLTGGWYRYSVKPLSLCTLQVKIMDAHANSYGHISSKLQLRCCTWMYLLLACHPCKFSWTHIQSTADKICMITLPFSRPSMQFTWNFCQNTCNLFIFVTGAFPVIFVLSFLILCSKPSTQFMWDDKEGVSSSQYLTPTCQWIFERSKWKEGNT